MTHTTLRATALPRTILLLLTTLSMLLALAVSPAAPRAHAAPVNGIFSIEMKANPAAFKSGKSVDIPIYLVENRDANRGVSWFKEYPHGIRSVSFDIASGQSRILSFTPAKQFDYRVQSTSILDQARIPQYRNQVRNPDLDGLSHVWLRLWSTGKAAPKVDNSGINGRTEVLLGTLKVKVGPSIKKSGRAMVFEMKTLADPSSYSGFTMWTKLPAERGSVSGGGSVGGSGLTAKHYQIHDDDPATDEHKKKKKKKKTTVTAELTSKIVKKGKTATLTVSVKQKKAAGKATVFDGKKVLAKVAIAKGESTVVKISTKMMSLGKHTITVKFAPKGKKFKASASKAITLALKR